LSLAAWAVVILYFIQVPPIWDWFFQGGVQTSFTSQDFGLGRWFANAGVWGLGVLSTVAVSLAYLGVGRRIASGWGLVDVPLPMRFALGGLGFACLWLGLGLCGLWFRPLLLGLLGSGILYGSWDVARGWGKTAPGPGTGGWKGFSSIFPAEWSLRFAFWVVLPIPLFALAFGGLPDLFYDTQVYHLAVPEAWLGRHGLCELPGRLNSHFPFLGEFLLLPVGWLTTWGQMDWIGTAAPRLMNGLSWVMTALLAGRWAKDLVVRSGDPEVKDRAMWAAFLLTVSCPLFCMNAYSAQVEGVLALMGLSSLYALDRLAEGWEGKAWGWACAAGLFLGASMMVKYNGVLIGVFLAPWFYRLKGRIFRRGWLLPMGLTALGMVVPWALKNWLEVGNPFYPYQAHWLGGHTLAAEQIQKLLGEQRLWRVQSPWDWFTLPWRLVTETPNGDNFVGPLTLVCALWLLGTRRRSPSERFLAWGCSLSFAVALSITHMLRFEAPLFPPLFVVAATVVARPPFKRSFPWVLGLSSLGSLSLLVGMALVYYSPQGVWMGREDLESYRHRAVVTPYASIVDLVRKATRPDERLLLAGDARTLGYGRELMAGTVFDEPLLVSAAKEEPDAEGIFRRMKRSGVDGILLNLQEGLRVGSTNSWYGLNEEEWRKLERFFDLYTDLAGAGELAQLYRLRKAPLIRPKTGPDSNGILFLDPAACDYVKAVRAGDDGKRQAALTDLCARQTFTPQWWGEQAAWWDQEGRGLEALRAWEKASGLGILLKEQYRDWALLAKRLKRPADEREAVALGLKWYRADAPGFK